MLRSPSTANASGFWPLISGPGAIFPRWLSEEMQHPSAPRPTVQEPPPPQPIPPQPEPDDDDDDEDDENGQGHAQRSSWVEFWDKKEAVW